MLTGEAIPGMNGHLGERLQSQTSALAWITDDLLVTIRQDESMKVGMLTKMRQMLTIW